MSSFAGTTAVPDRLSASHLRIFALASLGGALELYDFVIFAFLAKIIGLHFFPAGQAEWLRQTETFGLFGAGYLARPLGGLIMAHFGDVAGRRRIFMISALLMALPTFLIGLLPGYSVLGVASPLLLLVMRVMQGAAIGGEAPCGWVFVSEHAPPRHAGAATGLLTGGLTGGILLGSIVILVLHAVLTGEQVADWGWRLPFLIGGVFGFLSMLLRRWLDETPVFQEMHARAETAAAMPAKILLANHLRGVICSLLTTWTLTAAIVVLILMMPPLLQTMHHIPAAETMRASLAATLCLTISVILTGVLTDIFPLSFLAVLCAISLSAGAFVMYVIAPAFPAQFVLWAAIAGLSCGFVALVPTGMLRAFPPTVRLSGLSLSYNVSYAIFGGLTPSAISLLVTHGGAAPAIYVAGTAVIGAVALLCSPRNS